MVWIEPIRVVYGTKHQNNPTPVKRPSGPRLAVPSLFQDGKVGGVEVGGNINDFETSEGSLSTVK